MPCGGGQSGGDPEAGQPGLEDVRIPGSTRDNPWPGSRLGGLRGWEWTDRSRWVKESRPRSCCDSQERTQGPGGGLHAA